MRDKSKELIPQSKILEGMKIASDYAEELLSESNIHAQNSNFRVSIPLGIFSFEESSKIFHMYEILKQNRGITIKEWEDLSRHHVKLTQAEKKIKNQLLDGGDWEYEFRRSMILDSGFTTIANSKDDAIKFKQVLIEIQSKFEKIKERCFYSDWNENKKKWISFTDIPNDKWKFLSDLILYSAETKRYIARLCIEYLGKKKPDMPLLDYLNAEKIKNHLENLKDFHKGLKSLKEWSEYQQKINLKPDYLTKGHSVLKEYFSN